MLAPLAIATAFISWAGFLLRALPKALALRKSRWEANVSKESVSGQ
jgi:hypothetical protein